MYTPDVYILGSGAIFQLVLEGVQAIFDPTAGVTAWAGGNGPFPVGVLIKLALIVSVLVLSAKSVVTQRVEAHHAMLALGVYLFLFVPTTSMQITNVYNGNTRVVDGVPIGIAYPAGFISAMSYDMMNAIQTVDNFGGQAQPLLMSQTGYVGPIKLLMSLRSFPQAVGQIDPNLACSYEAFAQDCDAGSSNFNMQTMVNDTASTSTSIQHNMLNYYNKSDSTRYYNAAFPDTGGCRGGEYISCAAADADLHTALTNFFSNNPASSSPNVDEVLSSLTNASGGYDEATNGGPTDNVETALNHDFQSCNVNATGAATTCQASNLGLTFMENELAGCVAHFGVIGADVPQAERSLAEDTLPAFCTTMTGALGHQEARNAGIASMFEANVIPLMTVFQFLFFALAPIMAVVMVFYGPGGPQIYMKYLMFGIWSQSFLPIAALLNNYAQYQANDAFQHMLSGYMGGTGYVGLTNPSFLTNFSNMPEVFSYGARTLSMADFMISLTPVIAAMVLTGSYFALTSAASAITGNDSLNKSEDVATPNLAPSNFNQSAVGYGVQNTGAGVVNAMNMTAASGAPTVTFADANTMAAAAAHNQSVAMSEKALVSASQAVTATASALRSLTTANKSEESLNTSLASEVSESWSHTLREISGITNNKQAQQQIASTIAADVSAGITDPSVIGAQIKADLKKNNSYSNTQQQNKAIEHASQTAGQFSKKMHTALSIIGSHSLTSSDAKSIQNSLQDSKQEADQAIRDSEKAAQYTQQATQAKTDGANLAITPELLTNLLGQGGPESASQKINDFQSALQRINPSLANHFNSLMAMYKGKNKNMSNQAAAADAMNSMMMSSGSIPGVAEAYLAAVGDPGAPGSIASRAAQNIASTEAKTASPGNLSTAKGVGAGVLANTGTPNPGFTQNLTLLSPAQLAAVGAEAKGTFNPYAAVANKGAKLANAVGGNGKVPNTIPGGQQYNQLTREENSAFGHYSPPGANVGNLKPPVETPLQKFWGSTLNEIITGAGAVAVGFGVHRYNVSKAAKKLAEKEKMNGKPGPEDKPTNSSGGTSDGTDVAPNTPTQGELDLPDVGQQTSFDLGGNTPLDLSGSSSASIDTLGLGSGESGFASVGMLSDFLGDAAGGIPLFLYSGGLGKSTLYHHFNINSAGRITAVPRGNSVNGQ